MKNKELTRVLSIFLAAAVVTSLGACNVKNSSSELTSEESIVSESTASKSAPDKDSILITSELSNDSDGEPGNMPGALDGETPPEPPEGMDGNTPPEKPDGNPPEKPDGNPPDKPD